MAGQKAGRKEIPSVLSGKKALSPVMSDSFSINQANVIKPLPAVQRMTDYGRWSIPTNMATSSAYKVRVQSKTNAKQYDDSDSNFTITGGTSTTPTVSLSCNSSSASESGGKITCTLELSSSTTKTVTIKTSYSGTATAGTDYSGNTTTHTIAVGDYFYQLEVVTGKSDSKTEGNETIVINVTSVTNATESGRQRESLTLT